ncbi:MAG: DUF1232 domain-containing protein [Kaiparowitsia implicata GSE-PSE-MK54-09C]|nr:DUF1232 domain-containing protein [Kaiparowitsia implicata GSE-PSE-MK54-09C]
MKPSLTHNVFKRLLGHPKYRWVIILGAIAYLISPIDISPDVFPVLGWIDDGVLATIVVTGLTQVLLERRQAMKAERLTKSAAGEAEQTEKPAVAEGSTGDGQREEQV